ncbi:flagellar basal body P-ring formation chaperone FlgA [Dongshaea marina]|uniref:flagellar basal body P-ring formation chaperone FlgA n=1 Tax=Dongshaea marina TaxID=2047966 RepID=UPI000D3E7F74|nr:flagellar basal body P-ring formation chaperone FlgA [Dongshaea marina]
MRNTHLILMLLAVVASQGKAAEFHQHIEAEVKQFMQQQINAPSDSRLNLKVTGVDRRLNLPVCKGPLKLRLPGNGKIKRNTPVHVTCSDPAWNIYVPVRVSYQQPQVVAVRNMGKGQRITQNDLKIAYFDRLVIRNNGFQDPKRLIGTRLKRDVRINMPILQHNICVVCKQDKVNIIAKSDSIMLRTTGVALGDARYGQTVSVKNIRSGRKITARVTGVARVEVAL